MKISLEELGQLTTLMEARSALEDWIAFVEEEAEKEPQKRLLFQGVAGLVDGFPLPAHIVLDLGKWLQERLDQSLRDYDIAVESTAEHE